ncbi:MAG: outer membrane protein assembly factor BamA [Pseudomonadota bacterium]
MKFFNFAGKGNSLVIVVLLVLLAMGGAANGQPAAGNPMIPSVGDHGVLRLVFTGNDRVADSTLEAAAAEELEDFFDSDFPEAKADDAAFVMETMYRRQGYYFARVGYGLTQTPDATVLIFSINEGPRVFVRNITVTGNSSYSTSALLSFFQEKKGTLLGIGNLPFVEGDIQDVVSDIRTLYRSEGFLQAKIDPPDYLFSEDRSKVDIRLVISEGTKTIVGDVVYEGEILPEARSELDKLAVNLKGKSYLGRRKLMLRSGVLETYANLGYPEAGVEITEKREDPSRFDLHCNVTSGPRITVADIRVEGNNRAAGEFILKRISLQPGDLFSGKKKRESFQRLFQTGLFSRVTISLGNGPEPDKRELVVHVEESLSRELFFNAGWGSYEMLRASVGFLDRNIFGYGRSFRFETGGSVKSVNVDAVVRDPRIFGTDITADLPVFFHRREEPSFTNEELGASVLFSKNLSKDLSVSLRYLYSSTQTTDIVAEDVAEQESNYTIAGLKLQATLDNRNDIFFPTGGHRIFGSAEVAEPSLGSGLSFYRFNFGMRKFLPVDEKHTVALRYDTGVILPGRNQITIPIGERYFNGGENTVRSFLQSELGPKDASGDPLGGMAFNIFSIELRRLVTDSLAATLFVDYGNISPNLSPEEEDGVPFVDRQAVIDRTFSDYFRDFRPAVGMGFQYLLPVGPARLDFAWNPDQDKEGGEDSYTVHFSIGMAF